MTAPFVWVENHESFGFFRFRAEKGFSGPDTIGFVDVEGLLLCTYLRVFCTLGLASSRHSSIGSIICLISALRPQR